MRRYLDDIEIDWLFDDKVVVGVVGTVRQLHEHLAHKATRATHSILEAKTFTRVHSVVETPKTRKNERNMCSHKHTCL